jgi:hypothetical protein
VTNLTSSQEAIAAFKCRSGIEGMFKDCQTGGYNLEKIHANNQRLTTLILLIAIAYLVHFTHSHIRANDWKSGISSLGRFCQISATPPD